MHRFYINPDYIYDNRATIVGQDAKHLVTVLRLVSGNMVELVDGIGNHYLSEIELAASKKVILRIIERSSLRTESSAHITIAQGMLKDNKMDIILRHLTELGVKEWIPFFGSRSVLCPNKVKNNSDSIGVKVERWKRIARESIKQCGRTFLPVIHHPMSYGEMLNQAKFYSEKIVFWEKAITPIDVIRNRPRLNFSNSLNEHGKIIVMVGPEGGFSEQEVDVAKNHGFEPFSLGYRILRAETASIVASALIQNIFGDLGTVVATTETNFKTNITELG